MQSKATAKNAFFIGLLCSVIYLAVYIARNVLSAVSPQMLSDNIFSENVIGTLSSVFFFAYAIGQLINGLIGDFVKSKYMLVFGLLIAGVSSIVIPRFYQNILSAYFVYGIMGFALSMIYGPMTKAIAENTTQNHAVKCNLALNFASYFGTPLAGVLAVYFMWDTTFKSSGCILIVISMLCFIAFTYFERKNIIVYNQYDSKDKSNKKSSSFVAAVKVLRGKEIVKFTFVSILTGVIRTTVLFWLPTYLLQYLEFSEKQSTSIFTVTSLLISLGSFAAVYVYKMLKNSINKTLLFSFAFSAVLFLFTYIIKVPAANITLLLLAIIASNCAATMMWSFYCPSLADTGLVSSATGYLDFVSYMSAAIASKLFADAATSIGWGGLILVWMGLMILGIVVSLPYKKRCEV